MVLLAEELLTTTGVAGWTTFGLAGLILAWLFLKHLPDKDKQIRDLLGDHQKTVIEKDSHIRELLGVQKVAIDQKDAQIERMLSAKNEQIKILTESGTAQLKTMMETAQQSSRMMHEENQKALERVIKHCESEMRSSQELLEHRLGQLGQGVEDLISEIRELRVSPTLKRRTRQQQPPQSPTNNQLE